MTNTCLSQLHHTAPPPPLPHPAGPTRSHTTLQVGQLGSAGGQALGLTMGQALLNGSAADRVPTKSRLTGRPSCLRSLCSLDWPRRSFLAGGAVSWSWWLLLRGAAGRSSRASTSAAAGFPQLTGPVSRDSCTHLTLPLTHSSVHLSLVEELFPCTLAVARLS